MGIRRKIKRNILQVAGVVLALLLLIIILVLAMKLDAWKRGEEPWPDGHWYDESSLVLEESSAAENSEIAGLLENSEEKSEIQQTDYEESLYIIEESLQEPETNESADDNSVIENIEVEESENFDSSMPAQESELESSVAESESSIFEENSVAQDWGEVDWDEE